MITSHRLFWIEQPALLYSLSILIGSSSYLFWGFPFNWIWLLLWISYLAALRSFAPITLVLGSAVYAMCLYSNLPTGEAAYFSIASVQRHQSPFHKGYVFKGMAYANGARVPCSIYYYKKDRPIADCDYILTGKWIERGKYDYAFKAKEWTPVKNTWSLAEFRYKIKKRLKSFLEKKLYKTSSFLGALITGDVEDRSLRYEFNRLGLQHILAISGFHFSLLIAFCSLFLSLVFPYRWKLIALLIAVNIYFLFIGSVPAVQRSWIAATLYLTSQLIGRRASGLNILGVALGVEVILDPLISSNLGFQLSFLSCAGILLFYSPFNTFFYRFFPKRTFHERSQLPFFSRHISLLASFLRQSISLTFAVNSAILPILLYHFHQFPLLSLLYNLFFPFLVSLSMFALLISLLTQILFPPLAFTFFQITDFFTAQLLTLTAHPPIALDYCLSIALFPAWLIPLYLFSLLNISIVIQNKEKYIIRNESS